MPGLSIAEWSGAQLLIPRAKGPRACPSCRIVDFDGEGSCTDPSKKCVEEYRYIDPCGCMCKDMGFRICATTEPVELPPGCKCRTGPPQQGKLVAGAYIGWSDPAFGKTLLQIARRTSPANPHTYWTLWGSNEDTDLNCPITTDGWDLIEMGGQPFQMDLGNLPIIDLPGLLCVGGAFALSLEQILIEGPEPPDPEAGEEEGRNCVQTGGRDAYMMVVKDGNGKILVMCPFQGLRPFAQCDKQPCCAYDYSVSASGCIVEEEPIEGEEPQYKAHVMFHLTLAPGCTCTPVATLTVNGVDHDIAGDDVTFDYVVEGCEPAGGNSVTWSLTQFYGDQPCAEEAECENSFVSGTVIF